ncbi:MAG: type II secretion system protein M [Desulfobulbaceae bacterium]|nr:type II secretion system protein M [Desulfobulbaceae bacterium]
MVSWGGAFLLVLLGYTLLVAPLSSDLVQMEAAVASKKAEFAWMQDAAIKAKQLTALRSTKSTVSPLKVIDQAARKYGIDSSLKRVDPGETGQIKVWFENLVFVDFMRFLRGIGGGRGLVVTNLSVERLDAPGIVNARATFKAEAK